MNKRYVLKLTGEERSALEATTRRQNVAAGKHQKAGALLLCDQSDLGPGLRDVEVAGEANAGVRSVESWRGRAATPSRRDSARPRQHGVRSPRCVVPRSFRGRPGDAGEAVIAPAGRPRPPELEVHPPPRPPARPGHPPTERTYLTLVSLQLLCGESLRVQIPRRIASHLIFYDLSLPSR